MLLERVLVKFLQLVSLETGKFVLFSPLYSRYMFCAFMMAVPKTATKVLGYIQCYDDDCSFTIHLLR